MIWAESIIAGTVQDIRLCIHELFDRFAHDQPEKDYKSFQHSIVMRPSNTPDNPMSENDFIVTVIFEY